MQSPVAQHRTYATFRAVTRCYYVTYVLPHTRFERGVLSYIAIPQRSSAAERYNSCRQYRYHGVAHIPLEQPHETPDTVPAR